MKREQVRTVTFDKVAVHDEVLKDAKALRMPAEAAEAIAKKVAEKVAEHMKGRQTVADATLRSYVMRELRKYNDDLAYVYQNRGKII